MRMRRLNLTITDAMAEKLEKRMKKLGLTNLQEVIRNILAKEFGEGRE